LSIRHEIRLVQQSKIDPTQTTYWMPKYGSDIPLFMHCSGGSDSLTEREIQKMEEIFHLHGLGLFFEMPDGSVMALSGCI